MKHARQIRGRLVVLSVCLLGACGTWLSHKLDRRFGPADPRRFDTPVATASAGAPSFRKEVLPLLERRCVVCHACYDAPCQLKLGSWEGITRGASQDKVYDSERLFEARTTRLFEDAQKPSEWRARGFFAVLNERHADGETNRLGSVLYRMLALKRRHPLADHGLLSSAFDFRVDRAQVCPSLAQMDDFETQHPDWGMPYGLPGLTSSEEDLIARWLSAGAPEEDLDPLSGTVEREIATWEGFFAGDSLKERLVARYLYEHLFLAELFFEDDPARTRFRLVRSTTPPGQPIQIIATRRPYDDPKVARVYYRLQRVRESIVEKTDMPYALGPTRLARLREIFYEPKYDVTALPSYALDVASNPFVAFAALPSRVRYRFMLDDALLTIMGFIKGPVCRGQAALNVIEDQFWIFFADPDADLRDLQDEFLKKEAGNLRLPGTRGSNSFVLVPWLQYKRLEDKYLAAKSQFLEKALRHTRVDLPLVWDGDGNNPNAALTVFRHFDSATVVRGLVGPEPKTAWVLTYPELERIHYLLVAGFDVFGNVGHQLNTRLYMDFLRMEAEFNFLAFLPRATRQKLRDLWYRNAPDEAKEHVYGHAARFDRETDVVYRTDNPKRELFERLAKREEKILDRSLALESIPEDFLRHDLQELAALKGRSLAFLPELSVLEIDEGDAPPRYFTLVRNTGHSNVSNLFKEEMSLLPDEDTLTVVPGIIGAYPNVVYVVPHGQLPAFTETVGELESEADYQRLAVRFSLRRSNPDFWRKADALHSAHAASGDGHQGVLDLSRYENR